MKYKLNEIFYSIQTEGKYTGTPAVFIRFSGCNKNCWFCDTDHSHKLTLSKEEIMDKVKEYNCKRIILTGGEPLLQIDKDFIDFFSGYKIHIETNGTIDTDLNFHWITCSPKEDKINLSMIDELKVVYVNNETKLDYDVDCKYKYLQPCWDDKDISIVYDTINKVKEIDGWRLSFQLQKILNIQ